MTIPRGLYLQRKLSCDQVLKQHRNTYGQENDGRVWNQYLVKTLIKLSFYNHYDECVFYKGKVVYALYTDDSMLAGQDRTETDNILRQMRKAKLDITGEGTLEVFL